MPLRQLLIFIVLIFCAVVCLAQQPDVESFLERQDEYSDISDLLDMLAEFEKNPIELNRATIEQLTQLPWISDILARKIIQFRQQTRGFQFIEQLNQIEGIDAELLQILQNYVTISSPKIRDAFSVSAKARLSRRLGEPEGITRGIYAASPYQIYHRFIMNFRDNLKLGIVLEKDSGERRLDDLRLYFFKYTDKSNQKKLIFGNYRLEFGSGLIFGNPYYYSKGANPTYSLKRRTKELIEYTTVDENASLHGIAGQLSFKFYQILLFYSSNLLDASLNLDGTVKNFYQSGYHRSDSEREKQDNLTEQLIGARIHIKPSSHHSVGVTYYNTKFDRQFSFDIEAQNFNLSPRNQNAVLGFDYSAIMGQLNFLGEAALSRNGGHGLLAGVTMDANPLKLALLARNYTKNFISFHGNSFSEMNSYPHNEQGIYLGFQYNLFKKLKVALYFDQFKFPWSTYFIPMPSRGTDFFCRIEHKPARNLTVYFQIKTSQKDRAVYAGDELNRSLKIILPRKQTNFRLQIEHRPWGNISIRHRVEKNWVHYPNYTNLTLNQQQNFHGFVLYQDISFRLRDNLTFTGRITFFNTDNYDSRIYQFERDVPGMLNNQVLYDDGNLWYITLDWKLKTFMRISCKVGSIHYYYFDSIGSGLDRVPGNTLNSMRLQIEHDF